MSSVSPQRSDRLLEDLQLDAFFDETGLVFDLYEGTVWNASRTRLCVLSTDLLRGVYLALVEEAGPAWKIIFKNCGSVWGARIAKRLDAECQQRLGFSLGQLPLPRYLEFITAYFLVHGWGELRIDVSHARTSGIVEATLTHSIFADIVTDPEDMADALPCGMLAGLIGHAARRKLDAVQIACLTRGAPASRFLISAADRMKDAESMVKSGLTRDELLKRL